MIPQQQTVGGTSDTILGLTGSAVELVRTQKIGLEVAPLFRTLSTLSHLRSHGLHSTDDTHYIICTMVVSITSPEGGGVQRESLLQINILTWSEPSSPVGRGIGIN